MARKINVERYRRVLEVLEGRHWTDRYTISYEAEISPDTAYFVLRNLRRRKIIEIKKPFRATRKTIVLYKLSGDWSDTDEVIHYLLGV